MKPILKIIVGIAAAWYGATGLATMFILGSTPLIATEPAWALFLFWPFYWSVR